MKYYIGVDNGVSGTIGILNPDGKILFSKTPIKKELSYTKAKQYISRIDFSKLYTYLNENIQDVKNSFAIVERPMVNPGRFKATSSALRSLEATIIVLELLEIPYGYIDSKGWQKELLPKGLKGEQLKTASLDIGNRMFPQFKDHKHKDRDGLLLMEFCRRHF